MKYLFLIVRHFFPRRRYVTIDTGILRDRQGNCTGKMYVLKDQFGKLTTHLAKDPY